MNWYIVKNVFQIITGDGLHTPQFEERMILIQATSKALAYEKSYKLGQKENDQFVNVSGELVIWKFINTSAIHLIDSLVDGTTLCVRTEDQDYAEPYINFVNESLQFS